MLYMGMTIERKNIYLTGILFIPMNFIGGKKSVWKRQLIFCSININFDWVLKNMFAGVVF
jgi:hypothetical protein